MKLYSNSWLTVSHEQLSNVITLMRKLDYPIAVLHMKSINK